MHASPAAHSLAFDVPHVWPEVFWGVHVPFDDGVQ
jgi:hypothetical protein